MGSINDESWNYEINIAEIENKTNSFFDLQFNNLCEKALAALNNTFINIIEDKECLDRNNDEELRSLNVKNKELKCDIDTILHGLSQQQSQYENFKQDQKLLKQEVKETHEAFLMGRKYYKQFLNIYYTIESRSKETQAVFVQFFTELKKNELYSVSLQRNTTTQQYTLQSINPKLKCFKELQRKLQETNDVPSFLCCIREAFLAHKLNVKENN